MIDRSLITTYTISRVSVRYILSKLVERWHCFAAAQRQCRALQSMDDHLLSDIGMSRREARAEAQRLKWHALKLGR